jgi:hypothetical protein
MTFQEKSAGGVNCPPGELAWLSTVLFLKFGVFFTETLDSPGRVYELLFTGEKRVTLGTDFYTNIGFCGSGFKFGPASTFNGGVLEFWMNPCFHWLFPLADGS